MVNKIKNQYYTSTDQNDASKEGSKYGTIEFISNMFKNYYIRETKLYENYLYLKNRAYIQETFLSNGSKKTVITKSNVLGI